MKRFKRLQVFLRGDETDVSVIRYAKVFAGLCESSHVTWVVRGSGANDTALSSLLVLGTDGRVAPWTVEVMQEPAGFGEGGQVLGAGYDLFLVGRSRGDASGDAQWIAKVSCSVMLISPCSTPEFRKILVPVDFSERSHGCVEIGANLAKTRSINRLFLYHAVTIPMSWHLGVGSASRSTDSLLAPVIRKIKKLAAAFDPTDMKCASFVTTAFSPWLGIRQFEEELQPDLMILHARGKSGGNRRHRPCLTRILRCTHTTVLIYKANRVARGEEDHSPCQVRRAA
jgi:nucleotide-binding universal stress UspA family protein